MHKNVLSLHAAGMSYKWVRDTQSHVSSVAMKEVRPPNCWVSPDSLTYTVGVGSLHMDNLRKAVPAILEDIWTLYNELVGGKRFVNIPPEDVIDDLSNNTRGYSFASQEPFASRKHECFYHVVQIHRLCIVDSNDRISWNLPGVDRFLDTSAQLWRLIGYLLSFTAQISIRLQQFMEVTFLNADRIRSLIWQGGEGLLMPGYSKTSHITDQDGHRPAFLHEWLSTLLLEVLGGGLRETEAIAVLIKTGDPVCAQVHRT